MMENPDTNYVSYGHFALLADNYHWDNAGVDASSVFRELISRNRFPIYPDVLSIIVCKSGSFSLISGGRRITAGPKSAIVIFGRQPIDDVEISEDFRLFFFSGKSRQFNPHINLDDANKILRRALELQHPFLFELTSKEFHAVEKLYFSAKDLLQLAPEGAKEGIIAGYVRILSTLIAVRAEESNAEARHPSAVNRSLLASFLDNVRQHCHEHREVSFYSNLANLTPKYYSKLIRQLSGRPPGSIIEEYTMAEAKGLLASKNYSVKEVSSLMNFSSASSFCKYFKAAEGCTPGEYMKQH